MPRIAQYSIYLIASLLFTYLTWRFHDEIGFLTLSFKPEPQTSRYLAIRLVSTIVLTGITIFYLNTVFNAIEAISHENQRIKPAMVWATTIPLVMYIASFYMVSRLALSLESEYEHLGDDSKKRPTQSVGLAWCIFSILFTFLYLIKEPALSAMATIVGMALFVIYWVQLAKHAKRLKLMKERAGQFSFTV